MKLPVVVVAGLGRCGSSLVMQMLDKAGVPTVGTFPAYEVQGNAQPGQAVKWLDPLRTNQPFNRSRKAVVIWLDRDPDQQALSMVKMLGLGLAVDVPPEAAAMFRASIEPDSKRAKAVLGQWPKLSLTFEGLIEHTAESVNAIANFLRRYGFVITFEHQMKMVDQRISRDAVCAPDLSIELALIGESAPDEVAAHMEALTGARV